MTDFDESIPPSRRIFRRRFSASRIAEIAFGWLAKGTMIVVAIAVVVLSVFSDGAGMTSLPSTRRQWLTLALILAVVIAGVVVYCHYFPASPASP